VGVFLEPRTGNSTVEVPQEVASPALVLTISTLRLNVQRTRDNQILLTTQNRNLVHNEIQNSYFCSFL
jgi:hypothetical protein